MRDWKAINCDEKGPTFFELVKQSLSSTQEGYDLIASKFDNTPYCTSDEVLNVMSQQLSEWKPIDLALDICCGTGAMTETVLPYCQSRMVGYDLSRGMMSVASEKLKNSAKKCELYFVQGKLMELPFAEEFDLVTNFGGLGHVLKSEEREYLTGIKKILKPGGSYVFITADYPSSLSSRFWRAKLFNMAIHVRNVLIKPPFLMYYLTFCLPEVKYLLEDIGFQVEIRKGLFSEPFEDYQMVVARK